MSGFEFNIADIVALLAVVAVIVLALRSVIRGGALSCSDCNGDCGCCGQVCTNPKLKLSKEQEAELEELTRKYEATE